MSADILGTSWEQCRSMVQSSVTSTKNKKARQDGQPGTATSTLTQLLNFDDWMVMMISFCVDRLDRAVVPWAGVVPPDLCCCHLLHSPPPHRSGHRLCILLLVQCWLEKTTTNTICQRNACYKEPLPLVTVGQFWLQILGNGTCYLTLRNPAGQYWIQIL